MATLFKLHNFGYNGFYGRKLKGYAPYTTTFKSWTRDPGIAVCQCSDGKERLIPTFALEGDQSSLPQQDYSNKVYFGASSSSV